MKKSSYFYRMRLKEKEPISTQAPITFYTVDHFFLFRAHGHPASLKHKTFINLVNCIEIFLWEWVALPPPSIIT